MNPFYMPNWQNLFAPIQQRIDTQAANSQGRNNASMNQMTMGNWLGWMNPFRTASFRGQQLFQQPQHPMENFAPGGRLTPMEPMPAARPQQPDYRGFNQRRQTAMGPASNVGMGNYIDSFRGKPVGR